MTQIYPANVRTMSIDETKKFGLVNRGMMLDHGCVSYKLSAGTSDGLHVFKQGAALFVLTLNERLEYVALDIYMGKEQEAIDGLFLQGDYAISECVGHDWRHLPYDQLTQRLIRLFQ